MPLMVAKPKHTVALIKEGGEIFIVPIDHPDVPYMAIDTFVDSDNAREEARDLIGSDARYFITDLTRAL